MPQNFIKAVWAYIAIMLLIFSLFIPPFQKPDEEVHFFRALSVSKGFFFCSKKKGNAINLELQYLKIKSQISKLSIPNNPQNKFNVFFLKRPFRSSLQERALIQFSMDKICYYPHNSYKKNVSGFYFPFTSYIIYMPGLFAGNLLTANAYITFFLGRLSASIISFFIAFYLYKKIRYQSKNIILALFSIPMTLHQVSSYSFDTTQILGFLILYAIVSKTTTEKKISIRLYFAYLCTLSLIIFSRPLGYEAFLITPFLFFPLISLKKKFFHIATFIFYIFVIILFIKTKYSAFASYIQTQKLKEFHYIDNLKFIFLNIIKFIQTFLNTIIHKTVFYIHSTIGIFGWLDWGLSHFIYPLIVILICYISIFSFETKTLLLKKMQKFIIAVSIVLTILYIHIIMYITWTPKNYYIIEGVQGRYFIPFIPFVLFYLISSIPQKTAKKILKKTQYISKKPYFGIFFYSLLIIIVLNTIASICVRYF